MICPKCGAEKQIAYRFLKREEMELHWDSYPDAVGITLYPACFTCEPDAKKPPIQTSEID